MKAFQHIIVDVPATVKLSVYEDHTMRIEIVSDSVLTEHITIEVPRLVRLELDE